jgi:hypothetical protein
MIGQVESYDPALQTGVIKSEEKLFTFDLTGWMAEVLPDQGDEVSFDANESAATNINLLGALLDKPKPVKYKYVAALLALILGGVGAHRLYLGYYKIALAQLALTAATAGFGLLWGFVEAVLIFAGHIDHDAKGRPLK